MQMKVWSGQGDKVKPAMDDQCPAVFIVWPCLACCPREPTKRPDNPPVPPVLLSPLLPTSGPNNRQSS